MSMIGCGACASAAKVASGSQSAATSGKNIFGSGSDGSSSVIGNLLEGVFSSSKIEVKDLAGEWTANGSAVMFQSENLLNKAGGMAASAALESKLDSYYKQYGLNGAVLTVQTDGTFEMSLKKLRLKGVIAKGDKDGKFLFEFKALGKISLGKMTTYVQKTSTSMDVMFDAKGLQKLVSGVARLTGMSLAKTFASLLDSYDGLCVGFKMKKTGTVEGEESGSGVGKLLNGIFGGSKDSGAPAGTSTKESTTGNQGGKTSPSKTNNSKTNKGSGGKNAVGDLLDILNKGNGRK